ncbi:hypothetical protein LEP1GSC193_2816 [Leptospira alstonii serovar Pingchang str. 80-412]|uniref:Uncharacterized protein n=2 Tax=Leptospira alstonii TaxID=28452 RepID=M6CUR1_9LEPT|nr:hypothetical protein LEP1GSC194_0092 [Leptospira alstonii serovar Sichuan str. 79601]EQA79150.1 hypothetical protein LEP1GSC193_2816 [Leptospira alstonii serovar Pingchang str. 80-412]
MRFFGDFRLLWIRIAFSNRKELRLWITIVYYKKPNSSPLETWNSDLLDLKYSDSMLFSIKDV